MKPRFIIAIDLGGTNLKIALLSLKYSVTDKAILHTRRFTRKDVLIWAIIESIEELLADNNLKISNVLGLGLGLPGPIDTQGGIVHFFPNIPGWKEVPLRRILEKRLGIPVFMDNDANLMSLAEQRLGAARGFSNIFCLTLGTGVGGGIIINGEVYRSADNATGEIGHLPLNEDGPRCNCGGVACLESYIGNKKILKEAEIVFGRPLPLEEVSAMAKRGNRKAINIWLEVARRLGIALTSVINLLNPDVIVIGGGIANAGRVLFDNIKKTISERAMSVQAKRVRVVKAQLGSDAGLIGAAILVREGLRR